MLGYIKVYFRIRSKYEYDAGWPTAKDEKLFSEEVCGLFEGAGWTVKQNKDNRLDTAVKGKQRLYFHPMQFTGEILREGILTIENLLSTAQTFSSYKTDTYDEYFDMDDIEYKAYLESKRDSMVADLQEKYRTKRRNLYRTDGVKQLLAKKYSLHRLGEHNGYDEILDTYMDELIAGMEADGLLIRAKVKQGYGYRTATSYDAREKKGA